MKKLLSLALCIVMIFGVVAVNAVSFTAQETDSVEETAPAETETTPEETEETETTEETEAVPEVSPADLTPAGANVDLQETGITPQNIGNNFYTRVKLTKQADSYLTSPSRATMTPAFRKLSGYNEQVWQFIREGSFYRIRSILLNSYLEMKGSEAKEGDTLIFAAKRNAAEQKWIITKSDDGYQIHSFVDNKYVLVAVSGSMKLTATQTNDNTYFSVEKLGIKADKLAAPTVKLSNVYDGVLVDWNDVQYAEKYRVFRYNESTKKWDTLASVTESQYTDTKVSSSNTYKYAVKTISPVMSDYIAVSIKYIAAPRISINNTNDGPVLSWKASKGAERYKVFIKSGTKWSAIATTVGASYLHKAAEYNKTYIYTVRCVSANGKSYTSGFNTAGVSNMIVKTPSPKVTVMPFSLDVSWSKIDGAAKYRVFVKSKATNSKWVKAADVVGTSYRYSDVTNNTGYYFTVRAMNNKGVLISGYKSTVQTYFIDVPVVKTISTGTTANTLSWYAVNGAYKYRIYAWNGQQWIHKGDTAAYTTTFSAKIAGSNEQNICYAVRCLNKNGQLISSYLATVIEGTGLRYYFPGEYTSTHKF